MRNSSRTMRRAWSSRRVLVPGPGADQREAARPHPRIWFWFGHIGPIDSAMPGKRILGAQYRLFEAVGSQWREGIVANSPWRSKPPGLPARPCGGFPGTGRTLPSRHLHSQDTCLMLSPAPPGAEAGSTSRSRPPVPRRKQRRPRRPARTPPAFDIPTPSATAGGCSSGR